MNRPKSSSRLLSNRSRSRSNVLTTTSPLNGNGKSEGKSRAASSKRDDNIDKLPSLAKINREIMDMSAELLGQKGMDPQTLVDWIQDKRGRMLFSVVKY